MTLTLSHLKERYDGFFRQLVSMFLNRLAFVSLLFYFGPVADSMSLPIKVVDDAGVIVILEKPAQRILSLAPHITELLFAVGAGDKIAGTVDFSDYPDAARQIPKIGNSSMINFEAVLALKPDLIIAWKSGNSRPLVDKLLSLGIPVVLLESDGLGGVAESMLKISRLAGAEARGNIAVRGYLTKLDELKAQYFGKPPLRVFYQIWDQPLMTVNHTHLISQALALCGGDNIFSDLDMLAGQINMEAVIAADPDVIMISTGEVNDDSWRSPWQQRRYMRAVAENQLYPIPRDLISRATPRILEGLEHLCVALETARSHTTDKY